MKYFRWVVIAAAVLSLCSCNNKPRKVKTIYQIEKGDTTEVKTLSEDGKVIFDKESWVLRCPHCPTDEFTKITAYVYEGEKLMYEYYAHSMSSLRITFYDYTVDKNVPARYIREYRVYTYHNDFAAISSINTVDSLISYFKQNIPDSIDYCRETRNEQNRKYYYRSSFDSSGLRSERYWSYYNGTARDSLVEKYNSADNIVFKYEKKRGYFTTTEYKYDEDNNLIEDIEMVNSDTTSKDIKKYFYEDGNLVGIETYYGEFSGLFFKFFYDDTLLVRKLVQETVDGKVRPDDRQNRDITFKYEFYE